MGLVPLQGPSTRRSPATCTRAPPLPPRRANHDETSSVPLPAPRDDRSRLAFAGTTDTRRAIPKDRRWMPGTRCRLRDPHRKLLIGHLAAPKGDSKGDRSKPRSPPKRRSRTSYVGASAPESEEDGPDTVGIPLEVHRGPGFAPRILPEPDRSQVSGASKQRANPVQRANASGVCPEPKSTVLAHR